METGYLSIETHPDRPGLVRLLLSPRCPPIPKGEPAGPRLRFIARFNDGEAARMHAHQLLRRGLVDLGARLYRSDLAEAIGALDAIDLGHRRVYLDPTLAGATRAAIAERTRILAARRRRRARLWNAVGYLALGILLLQALAGLL